MSITKPIALDETLQATNAKLEAIKGALAPNNAVLFTSQNLTDAQKLQARLNIGAAALNPGLTNFAEMQRIVRAGNGPSQYPVGTIFYVSHTGLISGLTVDVPFEVVAHNHYPDPDGTQQYSMTVMMLYVKGIQFDAPEAFYYAENGLTAGSYYFKIGNTTYYFTITNSIAAGKQLYKQSNTQIYVFDPSTPTAGYEQVIQMNTTPIEGAANLGTAGDGTINHSDRISSSSSNYAQSAVRQWLNSNQPANQWWTRQTPWDRPSGSLNVNGFLYGINPDFLSIVGKTTITCNTNSTYEYGYTPGVAYTVTDKFFIPAMVEVGLSGTSPEGTLLDKYVGASNADRIKYDISNTASSSRWWSRTPNYASSEYYVESSGSSSNSGANITYGVAPACTIR